MELSPAILALITTQKQLSGWPIPLLRQLWVCMGLEFRQSPPTLGRQEVPVSLTARQQVILRLIAQGMTDKQIAAELRICQDTGKADNSIERSTYFMTHIGQESRLQTI